MSSHGRSRPIVVAEPCPGSTRTRSSRSARRASEAAISASDPPGRSVRPHAPANSVSPLYSWPSSTVQETHRAGGVPRRVEDLEPDRPEPDLAALGELHRRERGHDLERWREQRRRRLEVVAVVRMDRDVGAGVFGNRRVVADVIPVTVGADDQLERPAAFRERIGDPGEGRRRGVDGDRLARRRVGEHVDVGRDGPDDGLDPVHRPSVARVDRPHGRDVARGGARRRDCTLGPTPRPREGRTSHAHSPSTRHVGVPWPRPA